MSQRILWQEKKGCIKKITDSSVALLLIAALLVGYVTMAVRAVDAELPTITVTDGITPIVGADVTIEQVFDHSLIAADTLKLTELGHLTRYDTTYCQGGGIYDHYYIQAMVGESEGDNAGDCWFYIWDLDTSTQIAAVKLDGDGGAYKNNNANFGTEFYQEGDPFPLLYVSSAYDCRTVALRFYQDGEEWKVQQVQVIDYSADLNNENGFYSCNVMLDNENGFMYLTPINYTYHEPECTLQWIYKFHMPKLSDGEVVTISRADALAERFELEYEYAPQGGCIVDGKIYQTFGYHGVLRTIDLETGEWASRVLLTPLGCNEEPESCAFYKGELYFCTAGGGMWKISTTSKEAAEANKSQAVIVDTIELTKDADWDVGFLDPASGMEICPYDKIYRSHLIPINGAEYINIPAISHSDENGWYKWKIHWYGTAAKEGTTSASGIDLVGFASEQADFDTGNQFVVPEGAAYVRICIASVIGTAAEQTFDEAQFLSDGGMKVQLYRDARSVKTEQINSASDLELGFISHADGSENNSSGYLKHGRTTEIISTNGAKMLTVGVPTHPTVTNGDYYKWKVMFYQDNTFLGIAHEITDLATVTTFDVPEDANGYRIDIASVENGAAVNPFPLERFISEGGFSITYTGIEIPKMEQTINPWFDKTTLKTDANGGIYLDVPEGITVRYSVSAEGYETVTGTATSEELASGLSVQLKSNITGTTITVTDGTNPIPGANVTIEQVLNPKTITQSTLKAEYMGKVTRKNDMGIQSGAIFDHYYIHTGKGNPSSGVVWFYLWDLETNTQVASIPMQGDGGAYKNNNTCFGTEYYDENDKFPLLYVSSAYDIRIAVIRIYEEDGQWKAKQVQIIDYSKDFSNENGFYSCNLMLDTDNNFLWLTPIDNVYNEGKVTKQMFFKFHMPKFKENSTVVLERAQSLQYWETSYEYAPQGGFLQNNTIYQVFGPSGRGILRTFDLTTGQWTSRVNLATLGYIQEPEACSYYKGSIYSTCPGGNIWKITPTQKYESNATLLDSLALNDSTKWEVGFLATPGADGLVSGQEHSNSNNKIYRTDLIPTNGSEYIHIPTPKHYKSDNGGYYKWKIYWYGTDAIKDATTADEIDFISQAGEQSDFDCQNYFRVPDGAAYVRICVASVLSSGTEKVFPADKFYADGGLMVQRYRDEDTTNTFSINDSLIKGFIHHQGSSAGNYSDNSIYNKLVSTNKAYPTGGAKLLYVSVPAHPSAANGDYYKWKVLFYKGDTFLGLAHEIDDLENHPVFDIPAEADSFKISIASMVNDTPVNPFPLDDFIADGGMTITLAAQSNIAPELPWLEKIEKATDSNGTVAFDVVPHAVIKYAVSAAGYQTVVGYATAEQYKNGLNIALAAIKLGDANGDGVVDNNDAAAIKAYRAGLPNNMDLTVCDLDGNGKVDAYDAYLIQLYAAKKIDKFPCEN